jgi:hypothetical protein
MPTFEVDFSEVPNKVEPIDPGKYRVQVEGQEVSPKSAQAKTPGNNLVLTLKVLNGPESKPNEKFVGKQVKAWVATDNRIQLKQVGMCFGLIKSDSKQGFASESLLGKEGDILVSVGSFKGEDGEEISTNRVKNWVPEAGAIVQ